MKTLGFIGMGNMAGAIAAGIIQKGLMKKDEVFAYAPHYDKLVKNAEKIGFTACKELKELVAKTDTLIMACKPYQIEDVLSEIKEDLKGKALISIAAGWNYDKYQAYLDESTRFQFIMPNTPSMVGEGVLLFEEKNSLLDEEHEEVKNLFKALGIVIELPVHLMGIGGALTGCGQSSKDDKTESATAAETETISYDVLTQVRVGYMPNYESLWDVATAINKGYFEEQGLDIKLSSFQVDEAGIGLMASGSVDVAYIGADVHKQCIEGAAQIFCSSLKVSGETADCQGWGCLPGYMEANKDILVRFTKALYKAMDYGSQEANYDEVAGYVADICGADKATELEQAKEGNWIDSKTLLQYLGDGTLKKYYESQQKNFIDAGDVDKKVPIEDYVLFDVMEEAGK